jgi:hypothetical protein
MRWLVHHRGSTAKGLCDYALLLMMSTYSLGAGEAIRMEFDDSD